MIDLHRRGYLRGVERQLSAAQRSNTTLRSSIGDGARTQRGAPRLYRFAQKCASQSGSMLITGLGRASQREGLSYRSASS